MVNATVKLAQHRRRGYATEILRQSLIIARAAGVGRVAVTSRVHHAGRGAPAIRTAAPNVGSSTGAVGGVMGSDAMASAAAKSSSPRLIYESSSGRSRRRHSGG